MNIVVMDVEKCLKKCYAFQKLTPSPLVQNVRAQIPRKNYPGLFLSEHHLPVPPALPAVVVDRVAVFLEQGNLLTTVRRYKFTR
jgi:hypothetical protein